MQHCNNLPTKRGTQLHTNVDWKKFQRQRDHYHDDEPDTDQCVPVSTSPCSHDSPPLMMLCMDQWPDWASWAIRNIEAEINKKLSEYWIVTAPVTPPTAVTDNPVSACVWASSRHNKPQNSDARVTRTQEKVGRFNIIELQLLAVQLGSNNNISHCCPVIHAAVSL